MKNCEKHDLLLDDDEACPMCAHYLRHPDQWQPIKSAPKDATTVQVKMKDGTTLEAHWAEGGGDEQPYYRGWFIRTPNINMGIDDPLYWKPIT